MQASALRYAPRLMRPVGRHEQPTGAAPALNGGVPSMKIDLSQLSEQELVVLNRQIVERLRFLQQMRAQSL